MNILWFIIVNFGLMALVIMIVSIVAAMIGRQAGIDWLADRAGDLLSGPRNNAWLAVAICGMIALNIEAIVVYQNRPLTSPLPSIAQVANMAEEKASSHTDGHTIERLATTLNGGQEVAIQSQSTKNDVATGTENSSPSLIWLIAAILSWPIGIIWIGFILSDDLLGNLTLMVSAIRGKSATTAGEASAGSSSSGTTGTKQKKCWNNRFAQIFALIAGIVSLETVGELFGTILGKAIAEKTVK